MVVDEALQGASLAQLQKYATQSHFLLILLPIKVSVHTDTATRYYHDLMEASKTPESRIYLVDTEATMDSVIEKHAEI